jgi:MFS family permease
MLFPSIWAIGVGLVLSIIGSTLSSSYAKNSVTNSTGFGMLLTGICFFVLGIFGALLGTLQTSLNRNSREVGLRVDRPRFLSNSILSIGVGLVLTIVGSIVAGSYAKETPLNYTGFGMLLIGVAVLTLGMSGTAVTIVKSTWILNQSNDAEAGIILGSIWAIGIGAMLIITGSLIASSYAKTTLMNYSGFAMLLSGTAVFVYGLFETARFSTMGFLSGKWTGNWERRDNLPRLKNFWSNLVKTTAIFNLAGVMVAMGLLFFSLWQLDLIVSGPVWWQSSPNGRGWSWSGPGAYAKDYFQCFIWKTTVGQAYDTFFMLIFISFILLFASAFFWPRSRVKNDNLVLTAKHRNTLRNSKSKAQRKSIQKNQPVTPESPSASQEDDGVVGGT